MKPTKFTVTMRRTITDEAERRRRLRKLAETYQFGVGQVAPVLEDQAADSGEQRGEETTIG